MVEKIIIWDQIFEKILMNLYILRSPESENYIFKGWPLGVYYQRNYQTNYSYNSKLGMLHGYHKKMLLEIFMMIAEKACVQRHTKDIENITA